MRTPPPQDPTEALCLGTYGVPWGAGVSYERATPVGRVTCCDASRKGGSYEMCFNLKLRCNEVYYTTCSLQLRLKNRVANFIARKSLN